MFSGNRLMFVSFLLGCSLHLALFVHGEEQVLQVHRQIRSDSGGTKDHVWLSQYRSMVDQWVLKKAGKYPSFRPAGWRGRRPEQIDQMAVESGSKPVTVEPPSNLETPNTQELQNGGKNKKLSTFISSLLGSFLPVFDSQTQKKPRPPGNGQGGGSSSSYSKIAKFRGETVIKKNEKIPFKLQAVRRGHDDGVGVVHSGYAQVNKQSQRNANLEQPPPDMRRENSLPTPRHSAAFCSEALRLAQSDSLSKDEIHQRLRMLLDVFKIPMESQSQDNDDPKSAKRQLILVLDAICQQHEGGLAETNAISSDSDDEIMELDSLSSPKPVPVVATERHNPFLATKTPLDPEATNRRSDPIPTISSSSSPTPPPPFLSANFDESSDVITIRPNNPLEMSAQNDQANAFVVSSGFSFESGGSRVALPNRPLKPGMVIPNKEHSHPGQRPRPRLPPPPPSRQRPWNRHPNQKRFYQTQPPPASRRASNYFSTTSHRYPQHRGQSKHHLPSQQQQRTTLHQLSESNYAPSTTKPDRSYVREVRQTQPISTTVTPTTINGVTDTDRFRPLPSSAPPLPIMTTSVHPPSSSTRGNITLNDIHYVYNVTFFSPPNDQAGANSASTLELFPHKSAPLPQQASSPRAHDESSDPNQSSRNDHSYYPVRNLEPQFSPTSRWKGPAGSGNGISREDANHVSGVQGGQFTEFHAPPDVDMTYGTKTPNLGSGSPRPVAIEVEPSNRRKVHRNSLSSFFKAQSGKVPSLTKESLVIELLNQNDDENGSPPNSPPTFTVSTTTTTTTTSSPLAAINLAPTDVDEEEEYYYVYEDYYDSDDHQVMDVTEANEVATETKDDGEEQQDNEFANESAITERNNYNDEIFVAPKLPETGVKHLDQNAFEVIHESKAGQSDFYPSHFDEITTSTTSTTTTTTTTTTSLSTTTTTPRFYYNVHIDEDEEGGQVEQGTDASQGGLDLVLDFRTEPIDNDVENQRSFKHPASIRNDRFAEDGLRSSHLGVESSRAREASTAMEDEINPEKLAYILIGVCCGLSILCLIVVAISIGYKSETHYRLDEGANRKKHIKLLKASSSHDGEVTSGDSTTSETDSERGSVDMSNLKLGPWFNGKHNIQTLDRKSSMVFPTSVYLGNPLAGDQGDEPTTAKTEESTNDNVSLSSFDTIRTDPNLLQDHLVPHPNSRVRVLPQQADVHGTINSQGRNFKKNTSHNLASSSNRFSQGTLNLNKVGRVAEGSVSSKAREKRLRNLTQNSGSVASSSTGSFRYLMDPDTLDSDSSTSDKAFTVLSDGAENSKECNEIQWSNNTDRLI